MVDNRPPQQPLHMNSPSEEPLAPTTIPWTEFSSSPLQTTGLKRKHSSTSDQGSEPTRSGRRWLHGLKARLLDPSQDDSDPAPTDSGYVTGQGTPDTQRTVNRDTSTAGTSPVLGRDGWRIFHKSVSADKVARFREIVPELEKLLTAHLRERGGTLLFTKTPRLKPRAIRLLVLGACEEGAEETIVVFCSEQEMSRIQSFFDTDRIAKELCQPHDNALPCFRVLASGHPFRLTAGNGSGIKIETLADPDIFNGSRTICGQPILFRKIDQSVAANAHSCPVRKGTLGGIIQVILYDGTSGYYGMTAGHAVLDWLHDTGQHGCDEKRLSVELARLPTFGEPLLGEGFEPRPLTPEPDQERDETDDMTIESPWKFASSEAIGGVMGDSVGPLQLNAGSMLWACDLALVRLDDRSLFPNQLIVRDKKSLASSQSVIRKHDLCTVLYGFPDTWQDVVIMSASRGLVYGILSEIPARVSLGFDDAFLEVYVVTLNNDNGKLAPVQPLHLADSKISF